MIKVSRGGGLEVGVLGEILSNIKDNQKEVSESQGGRNTDMGMVPRGTFLCVERSLRILSVKTQEAEASPGTWGYLYLSPHAQIAIPSMCIYSPPFTPTNFLCTGTEAPLGGSVSGQWRRDWAVQPRSRVCVSEPDSSYLIHYKEQGDWKGLAGENHQARKGSFVMWQGCRACLILQCPGHSHFDGQNLRKCRTKN